MELGLGLGAAPLRCGAGSHLVRVRVRIRVKVRVKVRVGVRVSVRVRTATRTVAGEDEKMYETAQMDAKDRLSRGVLGPGPEKGAHLQREEKGDGGENAPAARARQKAGGRMASLAHRTGTTLTMINEYSTCTSQAPTAHLCSNRS